MRALWAGLLCVLLTAVGLTLPPPTPAHPLTVLIVTDMEGVMGAADPHLFYGGAAHDGYGRQLMTAEVQAALRGARSAGVQRILLSDSHFRGDNLNWSQLSPAIVRLPQHALEGSHPRTEVAGIFQQYHPDAVVLLGYHVMSGGDGFLPHTFVTRDRIAVNGREVGEIAMLAALAGHFGVPVVTVTGEAGAIREARAVLPGVRTAATKRLLPNGWVALEPLPQAEQAVAAAVQSGIADRAAIAPLTPARLAPGPVEHWSCTLTGPAHNVTLPAGVSRNGDRLLWQSRHYLDGYWRLFAVFGALQHP